MIRLAINDSKFKFNRLKMLKYIIKNIAVVMLSLISFQSMATEKVNFSKDVVVGAERIDAYLPLLFKKKVAIVGNQTSMIGEKHLVDTLLALGVKVIKVFAPEHGFRGNADAGKHIKDGVDRKTGVPIVSIYGKNKKPSKAQLEGIDLLVFDIQDVGARFYTYISSLHYIMEAAAENGKQVIVLDRPNPNGFYVDGPIREKKYKSFISMHPVPIVHGMTIGEYAQMINGEKWLKEGVQCKLKVIKCEKYDHNTLYTLPKRPSPNLPNMKSVFLYPSVCLMEATSVSVGRGTLTPFQIIGDPNSTKGNYRFIPKSVRGATKPKHLGKQCKGYDLRDEAEKVLQTKKLDLSWILDMYASCSKKETFFKSSGSFELLVGNAKVREMIVAGKTAEQISSTWIDDVSSFKLIRKKYLLYQDFE